MGDGMIKSRCDGSGEILGYIKCDGEGVHRKTSPCPGCVFCGITTELYQVLGVHPLDWQKEQVAKLLMQAREEGRREATYTAQELYNDIMGNVIRKRESLTEYLLASMGDLPITEDRLREINRLESKRDGVNTIGADLIRHYPEHYRAWREQQKRQAEAGEKPG